jgi:hypothetical protein
MSGGVPCLCIAGSDLAATQQRNFHFYEYIKNTITRL